MIRALLVTREKETHSELRESLSQYGMACSINSYKNGVRETVASQRPHILLFEINEQKPDSEVWEYIRRIKKGENLPVIALIPGALPNNTIPLIDIDDFIAGPYDSKELTLRINRLLHRAGGPESHEQIKCGGLMIDLATCEVTVEGKIVELTYKEFELLKLLASNKGRVYTREALLNNIWGYDYYGGDRTVDVHVRRLRSKIEDANHTFIETVRNIGYRFKAQ